MSLLLLLSFACDGRDRDGDGAAASVDCDDQAADVHPGASETCNDRDDDCDGQIDEDGDEPLFLDQDGDGYGTVSIGTGGCQPPAGAALVEGDCDDNDDAVNPGAEEICGDGVDNDCDPDPSICRGSGGTAEDAAAGQVRGTITGEQVGHAVAGAGDLDADGLADVVVGAPSAADRAGQVHVALGSDASRTVGTLSGDWPGDYLGWSVASCGDLDADGHAELALGAWGRDDLGDNAGAAYLIRGPFQGLASIGEADAATVLGTESDARFGWSLACGADLTGDGETDLAVGAWLQPGSGDMRPGAVWILSQPLASSGSADAGGYRLTGLAHEDATGVALATPGDVDGDGLADLLVGAPGHDSGADEGGSAWLVRGPVTSDQLLVDAGVPWVGTQVLLGAGADVSGAGDQDGDGLPDLLIGTRQGIAYVVSGLGAGGALADALAVLDSDDPASRFGQALAAPGDVDGDGADDLWIGAPNAEQGSGAAVLFHGPVAGTLEPDSATWTGTGLRAQAGYAVAGAGDTDGDGRPDLLLGAPGETVDDDATPGAAWLLLGGAE